MSNKKSAVRLLIIVLASVLAFGVLIGGVFLKDYWASQDSAKKVTAPPGEVEKPPNFPSAGS